MPRRGRNNGSRRGNRQNYDNRHGPNDNFQGQIRSGGHVDFGDHVYPEIHVHSGDRNRSDRYIRSNHSNGDTIEENNQNYHGNNRTRHWGIPNIGRNSQCRGPEYGDAHHSTGQTLVHKLATTTFMFDPTDASVKAQALLDFSDSIEDDLCKWSSSCCLPGCKPCCREARRADWMYVRPEAESAWSEKLREWRSSYNITSNLRRQARMSPQRSRIDHLADVHGLSGYNRPVLNATDEAKASWCATQRALYRQLGIVARRGPGESLWRLAFGRWKELMRANGSINVDCEDEIYFLHVPWQNHDGKRLFGILLERRIQQEYSGICNRELLQTIHCLEIYKNTGNLSPSVGLTWELRLTNNFQIDQLILRAQRQEQLSTNNLMHDLRRSFGFGLSLLGQTPQQLPRTGTHWQPQPSPPQVEISQQLPRTNAHWQPQPQPQPPLPQVEVWQQLPLQEREWQAPPARTPNDQLAYLVAMFHTQTIRGTPTPDGPNSSCVICLQDYAEGDNCLFLPCGHRFHYDCLVPDYFRISTGGRDGKCPHCRESFMDWNPGQDAMDVDEEYVAAVARRLRETE